MRRAVNESEIISLSTVQGALSCLSDVTVQHVSITLSLLYQFSVENPSVMMQMLPS
jgi:hypothetical protein